MSDERVTDRESGISIRFIRSFDAAKFTEECLRRDAVAVLLEREIYAGRLTGEGFYPSRVCSGRERLAE